MRVLCWLFLVGCGQPSDDPAPSPWDRCAGGGDVLATGSSTVATAPGFVYTVNADAGSVSRLDVATGAVDSVAVGDEPTRIARAAGALYVTLRASGRVAVVDEDRFAVSGWLATGAEPVGVVASADGVGAACGVQPPRRPPRPRVRSGHRRRATRREVREQGIRGHRQHDASARSAP